MDRFVTALREMLAMEGDWQIRLTRDTGGGLELFAWTGGTFAMTATWTAQSFEELAQSMDANPEGDDTDLEGPDDAETNANLDENDGEF